MFQPLPSPIDQSRLDTANCYEKLLFEKQRGSLVIERAACERLPRRRNASEREEEGREGGGGRGGRDRERPRLLCTATLSVQRENKTRGKLPRLFNLRRVNLSSMRERPRGSFFTSSCAIIDGQLGSCVNTV